MKQEKILNFFKNGNQINEFEELSEELANEYSENFAAPLFTSKETGISRRDLSVWYKEGLMPYEITDLGWKKYTYIECIWLKVVSKLKQFGLNNQSIMELKKPLFSQRAVDFRFLFEDHTKGKEMQSGMEELVTHYDNRIGEVNDEDLEIDMQRMNYSLFGLITMMISLARLKFVLVVNDEGDHSLINIGKPLNDIQQANISQILVEMSNKSFILINLSEIIFSFFENDKITKDADYFFGIMNSNEREIVSEIRSGKYKQVTVKINDGGITHLRYSKNKKENEAMIKRFSKMIKKGDYKKIELLTVDGVIVNYEEEDLIKIK